jgi:esterase/lipase superfamily enzyme
MRYQLSYYTDIFLEAMRYWLASMISVQASVAVLFTGIFANKILFAFGVSKYIGDAVFVPCAIYFTWAFCISLIDYNIDRSETL